MLHRFGINVQYSLKVHGLQLNSVASKSGHQAGKKSAVHIYPLEHLGSLQFVYFTISFLLTFYREPEALQRNSKTLGSRELFQFTDSVIVDLESTIIVICAVNCNSVSELL